MNFTDDIPSQYPNGDAPNFVDFVNGVYASATTAKEVKHVDFTPFPNEIAPISSLLVHLTWDTTMNPATVQPVYDSGLSEAALEGLKDNGFDEWLVYALQKAHQVGEEISLDNIPENELLLLHVYAITPCNKITMLTVPSQWYAHTGETFKEELRMCLPELDVGLRESNENRTSVRIGGPQSQTVPTSADPLQSADEALQKKPRCLKCKEKKKSCNRERPCERCAKVGLGFNDCIPEDESKSRNGFYGGRHTKGASKKSQNVELEQAVADGNGADATGHAPGNESVADTENLADDADDAAADDHDGSMSFFEQVNEYLGDMNAMEGFLELYGEYFWGYRDFEDVLNAATRFLDRQSELFAEFQGYLRGEEDIQELNWAYENFLIEYTKEEEHVEHEGDGLDDLFEDAADEGNRLNQIF
ncbi:uncharacterized protein N0V89_012530 [Didymosphaeria variabile]|uniref:Zn(2)-C6 fungal-type domain-containing protein n=1 Tax=Didymosphaeria variabile TaxID=1932322 RepID=A0A9W8X9K1_9PLEO|nr:uncharacterized protein N0V89_012530 [Didymosphaeria variabile]KAJ4344786.1 hypothetical protein N0V89_012530 [Didymosphaeria variabile]